MSGRRDALIAVACAACALGVFLANGRLIPTDDAIPARYLPFAILRSHTFYLDGVDEAPFSRPYFFQHVGGHTVSSYPVGAALIALPVYAPAVLSGVPMSDAVARRLEKSAAAVIVAASVGLFFLALRQWASTATSVAIAAVYAFGTSSFSQSSQALWQHGPAQLAICAALALLCRAGRRAGSAAALGACLALAVVCRPADILIAGPLFLYLAIAGRVRIMATVLGALVPAAFQLWYGWHYFGNPLHLQWAPVSAGLWTTPFAQGLAGLLASPGRGLFIYSPVLMGAIPGAYFAWKDRADRSFLVLGIGALLVVMLHARWAMWWGGACYGPRILGDITPVLALLMVPLVPRLRSRRPWLAIGLACTLWSVGAHGIGAFCGNISWNVRVDVDRHPERLWSWTDNQPVECVRGAAACFFPR